MSGRSSQKLDRTIDRSSCQRVPHTHTEQQQAYHLTRRDRLDAIMRQGLRLNSARVLTDFPSPELVRNMYGCIPLFVSERPWLEPEQFGLLADRGDPADFVLLRIDISGLPLAADIPMLSGKGAYLEDDHLWFKEDDHPLSAWVDPVSQAISYRRLVSDPDLIAAANRWTGTMAVLSSIEAERIQLDERKWLATPRS